MKPLAKVLAVFAVTAGLMRADDGAATRVELRDAPIEEALKKVGDATGRLIELGDVPADRKISFVARGTPDQIFAAFTDTLERALQVTIVQKSGVHRLKAFLPARPPAARLSPRGRRLSVEVEEGAVALVGDRGRVTVRGGERSAVASGSLPSEPVRFELAARDWVRPDAAVTGSMEARIPLGELVCRIVGYTDEGWPIFEYEVQGITQRFTYGEAQTQGIDRNKAIVEGGEVELPLRFKLKLEKNK